MIPPAVAENPNENDEVWDWLSKVRLEEFNLEDLDVPTVEKPPEFWTNTQNLPPEFVKPNEPKFNSLSPELKSLIVWQAENSGFKGQAVANMAALGQAQGTLDDDITIIDPPVAGDMAAKNRKRKEIEVDDNYESNARVSTYFSRNILVSKCQLLFIYIQGLSWCVEGYLTTFVIIY